MGEAYLESFLPSKSSRPTIFQVLSADILDAALRPALNYALRFLAGRYPNLSFVNRFSHEIYLVWDLILQRHYLRKHRASFSENFYGIQRLTSKRLFLLRSLTVCSLLPYAKAKLDALFENLRDEEQLGTNEAKKTSIKLFLAVWPYVHCLTKVLEVAFHLGYAVDKLSHHSPWMRLAGVELERATSTGQENHKHLRASVLENALDWLGVAMSFSLETAAFFLQFLEWWYSQSGPNAMASTAAAASLPIPPHPLQLGHDPLQDEFEDKRKLCPICRGPKRNETVLTTSGLVFCYACIATHIREVAI